MPLYSPNPLEYSISFDSLVRDMITDLTFLNTTIVSHIIIYFSAVINLTNNSIVVTLRIIVIHRLIVHAIMITLTNIGKCYHMLSIFFTENYSVDFHTLGFIKMIINSFSDSKLFECFYSSLAHNSIPITFSFDISATFVLKLWQLQYQDLVSKQSNKKE